jgi:hypothetical protein
MHCIAYVVKCSNRLCGLDTGDGVSHDDSCIVSICQELTGPRRYTMEKRIQVSNLSGHYSRGTLVEWRPNKRGQYTVVTVVQSSCIA